MEQLINIILPAIVSCLFSGLVIKISLSIARQRWSNNYQYTLICLLLPIITFVITKVISNNIALSLGMVGALSIVRFRNPVKNSLELVTYFSLIAVGIAAGVNIKYAVLLGILVSSIIVLLKIFDSITRKYNVNFSSLSHNDDNDFNSVEIEATREIDYNLYKKYIQNIHSDKSNNMYYYRFASQDKKKIDEIYKNFKSLDEVKSIDIKYE